MQLQRVVQSLALVGGELYAMETSTTSVTRWIGDKVRHTKEVGSESFHSDFLTTTTSTALDNAQWMITLKLHLQTTDHKFHSLFLYSRNYVVRGRVSRQYGRQQLQLYSPMILGIPHLYCSTPASRSAFWSGQWLVGEQTYDSFRVRAPAWKKLSSLVDDNLTKNSKLLPVLSDMCNARLSSHANNKNALCPLKLPLPFAHIRPRIAISSVPCVPTLSYESRVGLIRCRHHTWGLLPHLLHILRGGVPNTVLLDSKQAVALW